jgi:hypothetical protein
MLDAGKQLVNATPCPTIRMLLSWFAAAAARHARRAGEEQRECASCLGSYRLKGTGLLSRHSQRCRAAACREGCQHLANGKQDRPSVRSQWEMAGASAEWMVQTEGWLWQLVILG